MSTTISGLFLFRDQVLRAIGLLKQAGFSKIEVMAPVPDHEILEAVGHRPSKVGLVTLIGGLAGLAAGFGGAAWAHLHWGSVIGGKPVVSIPPLVVVAFECTVLFAAVATLAGVLMMCRLPSLKMKPGYDPRVSEDCYVVLVETEETRGEEAAGLLRQAGAEVKL